MIQSVTINFSGIFRADMFDQLLEVDLSADGRDLSGRSFMMQIRESEDVDAVVTFKEDDATIVKTSTGTNKWDLQLYQDGPDMDIPINVYYYSLRMFTDDSNIEDGETLVTGTFEIVAQQTDLTEL